MIIHIRTFFFPNQYYYKYDLSKELIVSKLNDVFNRKWNLFDSNNLEGEFIHKETFVFRMKSAAFKTGLIGNSSMTGYIKEIGNGQTEINLKLKPYIGLYITFILFVVSSLVYLYNSLDIGSILYTLLSCLWLIGGPLLCIWISTVQNEALMQNYIKYLDKMLRKN